MLVKVHATTVNRTDCGFRAAKPFFVRFFSGLLRPKATILGSEFAGVVEAVGRGVTSFEVGDEVFGFSEGPVRRSRRIPVDARGRFARDHAGERDLRGGRGQHRGFALRPVARSRKAKIRSGQDVLVNGATGAIGSAAVQLLKSLGAVVTAVCATEHVELVRGLGADRVIDYTAEDFTKDEQTYDVVLDAVGKSSFGRCKRLLKPGGIYLSSDLGPWPRTRSWRSSLRCSAGRRSCSPSRRSIDQAEGEGFKEMIESGEFTPVIDRRYPLDQIVEAYRYVETGQKIGNVVIIVDPAI